MENPVTKTHNLSIDILRIVSILAVVLIHSTTRTFEFTHSNLLATQFTLFLNQVSRFAVPLFFMISGFVLELSYPFHDNPFSYLRRRITRIFIPYLFWSAFYIFLIYPQPLGNYFSTLLSGSASYQLYFIPTLLIFYLLFPLIHNYYHLLSNKFILIILGLIQICFLIADYYFHSIKVFYPLAIAMFNFYPFILGIVASHHQSSLYSFFSRYKYGLVVLTFLSGIFVFWEGGSRYFSTNNYLSFYSQWRPSVLFYTLCLASLLYYLFNRATISDRFVKILSELSFFVFFIHIAVLEISWKYIFIHIFPTSLFNLIWFDQLFFLFITIVSFSIAYLCHKIPLLPKLTG